MTPEQLIDAKAKYHLLVTGQAARVVLDGASGDRVEFQGANAAALLDYIRSTDPTFMAAAASISRPYRFIF